jgi:hypothetical protein
MGLFASSLISEEKKQMQENFHLFLANLRTADKCCVRYCAL